MSVFDLGRPPSPFSPDLTGTERCNEAVSKLKEKFDIVVNIQGDEPLIEPEIIDEVANCLKNSPEAVYSTACTPLKHEDVELKQRVKCITDKVGTAVLSSLCSHCVHERLRCCEPLSERLCHILLSRSDPSQQEGRGRRLPCTFQGQALHAAPWAPVLRQRLPEDLREAPSNSADGKWGVTCSRFEHSLLTVRFIHSSWKIWSNLR